MKFLNEIWVLIPARSGSTGLKNKNIKKINGKPLIYYSLETAHKVKKFKKIIFSSDSDRYINIAKKYFKNILIHKRGIKTSSKKASELSVFQDFIKKQKNILPKYFAHLRPTCPIRKISTINNSIDKFMKIKKKYSSLKTVTEMSDPAYRNFRIVDGKICSILRKDFDMQKYWKPRQSFEKTYFGNCIIDIYKTENILKGHLVGNKIFPHIVKDLTTDIDSMEDFKYSKYLLAKNF
jgi:CMP-N,N'-diacetyllegionaminic acid synthase